MCNKYLRIVNFDLRVLDCRRDIAVSMTNSSSLLNTTEKCLIRSSSTPESPPAYDFPESYFSLERYTTGCFADLSPDAAVRDGECLDEYFRRLYSIPEPIGIIAKGRFSPRGVEESTDQVFDSPCSLSSPVATIVITSTPTRTRERQNGAINSASPSESRYYLRSSGKSDALFPGLDTNTTRKGTRPNRIRHTGISTMFDDLEVTIEKAGKARTKLFKTQGQRTTPYKRRSRDNKSHDIM